MESADKFHLGKEAYGKGNYSQAIDFFSQVVVLESTNVEVYYQRGLSYFHLGDKAKSLLDFNAAVLLDPNNPFRYSSRAFIKDSLGDTDLAIEDYRKAIELDPKDAVAHNNLGLLEEKLGRKQTAKKHFEKADAMVDPFLKNFTPKKEFITQEENRVEEVKHAEQGVVTKKDIQSYISMLVNVFVKKNQLREFVRYIKNGFKL